MHVELAPPEEQPELQPVELPKMEAHHTDPFPGLTSWPWPTRPSRRKVAPHAAVAERRPPLQTRKKSDAVDPNDPATWGRTARNAVCPCGSGKKYKHCHGKHE